MFKVFPPTCPYGIRLTGAADLTTGLFFDES